MPILTYLTETHFDFGAIKVLPTALAGLGVSRPLVVTDPGVRRVGIVDRVVAALENAAGLPVYDGTPPNPTEKAVLEAEALYRAENCDGVVAIGGGSAMDLGKAVALLVGSGGPLERFDPLQKGAGLVTQVAPLIAVPTTSGTGSEVSLGAVITMLDGRKLVFASPKLFPKVAICDPELTLGLPAAITAGTGMDAITHCIEAIMSRQVNPPAEGVGYDGLWRGWRNLPRAVADGGDREARWEMMMASTEGALAFIKGLGAVHAMSHSAGRLPGRSLHHGTLNAVILPAVLRFHHGLAPEKEARMREAMGLAPNADLAEAVEAMNQTIGMPRNLAAMGVTAADLPDLVKHAVADLSGRTNPRKTSPEEYQRLFEELL